MNLIMFECVLLLPVLVLPALGFVHPLCWTTTPVVATERKEELHQYRRDQTRATTTQSALGGGTTGEHVPSDSHSSLTKNLLEQLQLQTTIWADTADVSTVQRLNRDLGVVDVTTNPSIVSATARKVGGAAAESGSSRITVRLVIMRMHG